MSQTEPIPYRDTWSVCANCEHKQVHHGYVTASRVWVDDHRCWARLDPPRFDPPQTWAYCPCPGWAPGPQR